MLSKLSGKARDLTLVFGVILILFILFSPIPPYMLDLAIIINFGLGLTILLLTFYVTKPVEFSTFPSLLLVATLFRLSLNVASTRLILTDADAGEVIGAIGTYAVQNNFIIGLVVFFILVVVQYIVVTSGAQRVSEVAARFTLDSMPGQQMSIDADLNMGLIDQNEAIARRKELEKEASFYGSMDGASKFVKGDAIAGIIILLINIIAGWIIGVVQMGMNWLEALERFTLLTIGDGIATQLPALIISIATGIIVTRSSADKELSTEVMRQLSSVPRILVIVTVALMLLMLMPGMPKWPIVIIIGILGFAWIAINRRMKAEEISLDRGTTDEVEEDNGAAAPMPIEIKLGAILSENWKLQEPDIFDRIALLRKNYQQRFGFAFPAIKLSEGQTISANEYHIMLYGVRHGEADIYSDMTLAVRSQNASADLNGIPAKDPAFGLPAFWIEDEEKDKPAAEDYTFVDPITVLITHLGEVLNDEVENLLTRNDVVQMLESVRTRQAGLIEDLIPNIMSVADIQRVLQNLLAENVSIANIDLIAETLVDSGRQTKDTQELTEMVRQKMKHSICQDLRGSHSDLSVLSLDPRFENQIATSIASSDGRSSIVVEPKLAEQLIRKLVPLSDAMVSEGRRPVLLCGPELRRHLKILTRRSVPRLSILSVNEVPMKINLKSFDVVKFEAQSQ